MLNDPVSPSLIAGEYTRQLHPLRQWVEVREYYRSLFRHRSHTDINRLTGLTVDVWNRPARYR